MGWKDYDFTPPSRPREAKGGINASSKRGVFGASWWGKRWIEVLESFHIGARLTRGRSYARRGQVLTLTVNPGRVTATVQGSRPKPYQVDITVKSLGASAWNQVAEALRKQALFAAKLIAGEMPAEIEQAFTGPGVSLFPAKYAD